MKSNNIKVESNKFSLKYLKLTAIALFLFKSNQVSSIID